MLLWIRTHQIAENAWPHNELEATASYTSAIYWFGTASTSIIEWSIKWPPMTPDCQLKQPQEGRAGAGLLITNVIFCPFRLCRCDTFYLRRRSWGVIDRISIGYTACCNSGELVSNFKAAAISRAGPDVLEANRSPRLLLSCFFYIKAARDSADLQCPGLISASLLKPECREKATAAYGKV